MILEPFRGLEQYLSAGEDAGRASVRKGESENFIAAVRLKAEAVRRQPSAEWLDDTASLQSSLSSLPFSPQRIKGQLCGPYTLLQHLQYCGKPVKSDDALAESICELLCARAEEQAAFLRQCSAGKIVMIIDEPVLPYLRRDELKPGSRGFVLLERLVRCIAACGAEPGIHCCSPVPGPLFAALFRALELRAISFAVEEVRKDLTAAIDPLLVSEILSAGGTVLWGLVPTQGEIPRDGSAFSRWLLQQIKDFNLPREYVRSGSAVTATCGLGLLTAEAAPMIFGLCGRIAEEVETRL
jgi:hypothetical protein